MKRRNMKKLILVATFMLFGVEAQSAMNSPAKVRASTKYEKVVVNIDYNYQKAYRDFKREYDKCNNSVFMFTATMGSEGELYTDIPEAVFYTYLRGIIGQRVYIVLDFIGIGEDSTVITISTGHRAYRKFQQKFRAFFEEGKSFCK